MASRVITLGGLPNSGKSTVATLLARALPRTVRIELDSTGVGHVVKTLPMEEKKELQARGIHAEIEDSAAVAVNWLQRGYDVVLVGLFNKGALQGISSYINKHCEGVHYLSFGLAPPLEVSLGPRGTRVPDGKEQDFIRSLAEWYQPNGFLIDNQDQTPEETVAAIVAQLAKAD